MATADPPESLTLALDLLLEIDGPVSQRLERLEQAPTTPAIEVRRSEAARVAGRVREARDAAERARATCTGSDLRGPWRQRRPWRVPAPPSSRRPDWTCVRTRRPR